MRLSLTLQQVLDNLFLIFCIRLNQRFRKQKFGSSSAIYYIVLGVCCPGGEDKVNCALFLLWGFFFVCLGVLFCFGSRFLLAFELHQFPDLGFRCVQVQHHNEPVAAAANR